MTLSVMKLRYVTCTQSSATLYVIC